MSHLQKRYLDYYYVKEGKGDKEKLVKVPFMNRKIFMEKFPNVVLPTENPYLKHEDRVFHTKKKKKNFLHARKKQKLKARRKAKNRK